MVWWFTSNYPEFVSSFVMVLSYYIDLLWVNKITIGQDGYITNYKIGDGESSSGVGAQVHSLIQVVQLMYYMVELL